MFSTNKRCQYRNNQLAEVICQLRFPEILTINANPPATFQDCIRNQFPCYSARLEAVSPRIAVPGSPQPVEHSAVNNYQFATEDGIWRINLTSRFISLSCAQYTNWGAFAQHLDEPLAAFIKNYSPSYFERIGLRYVNFISKKSLELENVPFSDLIQPAYLGVLGEDDVTESTVSRSSVDAEISIRGGCRAKIHAGPGMVKRNGKPDNEIKFVFDQDLFMPGNIPVNYAAGALETLHCQAYPIFRGAITDLLHNTMEPESI